MTELPVNPLEIRQRDSVYRRGVLLGMTLAEIMILVLFCMLMAFVLKLENYEKQLEHSDKARGLMEKIEQLLGEYDDTWTFLTAVETIVKAVGVDSLNSVANALQQHPDLTKDDIKSAVEQGLSRYTLVRSKLQGTAESPPVPEAVSVALEEQLAAGEQAQKYRPAMEVVEAVRNQLSQDAGREPSSEELNDAVRQMLANYKALQVAGENGIESALLENHDLNERLVRMGKALAKATDQLNGKGQGLVLPSCFETSDGDIQYVFDIDFDEDSLHLVALPVPGNEQNWERLNFQQISTGKNLKIQQYLEETREVFEWSTANACRFFVRIHDNTRAENKSQYKLMKRKIEYRFYTFEPPQTGVASDKTVATQI